MAVALTTIVKTLDQGQALEYVLDITFSGTYVTAGVDITTLLKSNAALHSQQLPWFVTVVGTGATWLLDWTPSTNKLVFYVRTTGVELANGVAINNTARIRVLIPKFI